VTRTVSPRLAAGARRDSGLGDEEKIVIRVWITCFLLSGLVSASSVGQEWWKPYLPPCMERENVFEFTESCLFFT